MAACPAGPPCAPAAIEPTELELCASLSCGDANECLQHLRCPCLSRHAWTCYTGGDHMAALSYWTLSVLDVVQCTVYVQTWLTLCIVFIYNLGILMKDFQDILQLKNKLVIALWHSSNTVFVYCHICWYDTFNSLVWTNILTLWLTGEDLLKQHLWIRLGCFGVNIQFRAFCKWSIEIQYL